jgi:heme/copper-type cytochrome/quinol oxidase subunit 4
MVELELLIIEKTMSQLSEVIGQMRFLHNNKGSVAGWLWSAIVVVVLIIVLVVVLRFLFHLL